MHNTKHKIKSIPVIPLPAMKHYTDTRTSRCVSFTKSYESDYVIFSCLVIAMRFHFCFFFLSFFLCVFFFFFFFCLVFFLSPDHALSKFDRIVIIYTNGCQYFSRNIKKFSNYPFQCIVVALWKVGSLLRFCCKIQLLLKLKSKSSHIDIHDNIFHSVSPVRFSLMFIEYTEYIYTFHNSNRNYKSSFL